jgi:hypothetical protein
MRKTTSILKAQANCSDLEDTVIDYVRNYLVPGQIW